MSTLEWLDASTGPGDYYFRRPNASTGKLRMVRAHVFDTDGTMRVIIDRSTAIRLGTERPGQWLPIPDPDELIALGACEELLRSCLSVAYWDLWRVMDDARSMLATLDKARKEKS